MKTIKIKLYEFSELSEQAKKTAIENLYDCNVNYEWWECMYDDAENIGLKITSFDLDRNRHAKGEFNLSPAEVAQNILNEHGNMCETYKTAEKFLSDFNPLFADYLDEASENYESLELENQMLELETEFLNSLLEDYSILLQKEYEYLCSEDAIIETIETYGYDFKVNGEIY